MYLRVCRPVCMSAYMLACLVTYPFVCLYVCLAISAFECVSFYISVSVTIYLGACRYVYMSIFLSICFSVCLYADVYVCLSILSIYLYVSLSVCTLVFAYLSVCCKYHTLQLTYPYLHPNNICDFPKTTGDFRGPTSSPAAQKPELDGNQSEAKGQNEENTENGCEIIVSTSAMSVTRWEFRLTDR